MDYKPWISEQMQHTRSVCILCVLHMTTHPALTHAAIKHGLDWPEELQGNIPGKTGRRRRYALAKS